MSISRRNFLQAVAAGAATTALPAWAQSNEVYFVTYPGSVDEAFKKVVGPAFSKQVSGASAIFTPMLNVDLIGKVKAAQSNPPYDASIWDNGPLVTALRDDLLEKFDPAAYKNVADLPASMRNPSGCGPVMGLTAVGIAYNPKKITTPPTSWLDLWDPKYKGRVGLVGPASTLGATYMIEVSKARGGSETNIEPAFAALKQLLPNVGVIAPSPGALMTAFQQGQVDIGPQFFNNVAALRSRGGDIAFAIPKEGLPLQTMTVAIIKNAKNRDNAKKLIEVILEPDVQRAMEAEPYVMLPTTTKVKLTGQNAQLAPSVEDLLKKGSFLDWSKFIDARPGWVDRFNREIKL
jgi:putative spermidine/putrescine transport system substrate-binding protein